MMNTSASSIYQHFKKLGFLSEHIGSDNTILGIADIEDYQDGDLVFVQNDKYSQSIIDNLPAAVVTTREIAGSLQMTQGLSILIAENVKLASAYIRQKYTDRDFFNSEWQRVHGSAVIHESTQIPEDVVIGPGAIVGARVVFGSRAVILANCVIEHDAVIGIRTVIHPNCVIGYECQLGDDVILKSGCIIGSEGAGFAQDEKRHHHRIPHVGKVVIEDRVVMGANSTVDRATFKETRIRSGCIIDALCHVAHNVTLGEDCILVAQTGIAGSSRFGDRVIASGQTGVLDHVSVPDDTVLLHRAGVINSIKESGTYAATPPQPFRKYVKNIAVFQRLHEVWSRLKALEKKVAELSG